VSLKLAGDGDGMNALRVLRGTAWGCLAVIAILSLLPAEEMVRTGLSGHIEHAIAYAAASVIVLLAYGKHGLVRVAAGLILYAGVLEFLQRFSPGRHSGVDDFLASSTGVLIGIAALMSWRSLQQRRASGVSRSRS